MNVPCRYLGALLLASVLSPSNSPACGVAPFNESWNPSGSIAWIDSQGDCVLQASVSAARPAAAIVHYRRADRTAPLRLGFVLTPAPALNSIDDTQSAILASGTALSVPAGGPSQASLFRVKLTGDASGAHPQLVFQAACVSPAGTNGMCSAQRAIDFSGFPLRVTLQLTMGAASAGQLKVWLGDDVSGAPTLSLDDLDNERWGGIDRVGMGLSDVSGSLAPAIDAQPFSFSEITVNEPRLFWSDFESDLSGGIVATGAPIGGLGNIGGDTCEGQSQFPAIASGTTQFAGLTMVHPLHLGPSAHLMLQVIPGSAPVSAFACPAGSGPSGPCVRIAGPLQDLNLLNLPAGDYQVVVGRMDASCGRYVLNAIGSAN